MGDKKLHNADANPGTLLVMYVEDDVINQQVMQSMLMAVDGANVVIAQDEHSALEVLEEEEHLPDLVFMDNQLLNTSGSEVIEAMRKEYGNVFRFVMCTAKSKAEAEELTKSTNAMGFICKPYTPEQLLNVLHDTVKLPVPDLPGSSLTNASSAPDVARSSRGSPSAAARSSPRERARSAMMTTTTNSASFLCMATSTSSGNSQAPHSYDTEITTGSLWASGRRMADSAAMSTLGTLIGGTGSSNRYDLSRRASLQRVVDSVPHRNSWLPGSTESNLAAAIEASVSRRTTQNVLVSRSSSLESTWRTARDPQCVADAQALLSTGRSSLSSNPFSRSGKTPSLQSHLTVSTRSHLHGADPTRTSGRLDHSSNAASATSSRRWMSGWRDSVSAASLGTTSNMDHASGSSATLTQSTNSRLLNDAPLHHVSEAAWLQNLLSISTEASTLRNTAPSPHAQSSLSNSQQRARGGPVQPSSPAVQKDELEARLEALEKAVAQRSAASATPRSVACNAVQASEASNGLPATTAAPQAPALGSASRASVSNHEAHQQRVRDSTTPTGVSAQKYHGHFSLSAAKPSVLAPTQLSKDGESVEGGGSGKVRVLGHPKREKRAADPIYPSAKQVQRMHERSRQGAEEGSSSDDCHGIRGVASDVTLAPPSFKARSRARTHTRHTHDARDGASSRGDELESPRSDSTTARDRRSPSRPPLSLQSEVGDKAGEEGTGTSAQEREGLSDGEDTWRRASEDVLMRPRFEPEPDHWTPRFAASSPGAVGLNTAMLHRRCATQPLQFHQFKVSESVSQDGAQGAPASAQPAPKRRGITEKQRALRTSKSMQELGCSRSALQSLLDTVTQVAAEGAPDMASNDELVIALKDLKAHTQVQLEFAASQRQSGELMSTGTAANASSLSNRLSTCSETALVVPHLSKREVKALLKQVKYTCQVLSLPAVGQNSTAEEISIQEMCTVLDRVHLIPILEGTVTVSALCQKSAYEIMQLGVVHIEDVHQLMSGLANLY